MHLHKWLAKKKGRHAALAAHFNVTASSITQWEANGVPVTRMAEVSKFTRSAVTVDEMVREAARLTKAKQDAALAAKAAAAAAAAAQEAQEA